MAGAWQRGITIGNAQSICPNYSTSNGTQITASATPFAKGAWTQLIASTTTSTSWAWIEYSATSTGTSRQWAVDVAVGASGSEVNIITDLVCKCIASTNSSNILLPLKIKAGTRIAARGSCEVASDYGNIQIILFGDAFNSAGAGGSVTTYGFTEATNSGTQVDSGAVSYVKGVYAQLTASLTYNIAGFFLGFDPLTGGGSDGNIKHLVDVAIGASGSEVAILPNFPLQTFCYSVTNSGQYSPNLSPYFPMPIEAGMRVSVRASSSDTGVPDRYFGVTFYGVRQ